MIFPNTLLSCTPRDINFWFVHLPRFQTLLRTPRQLYQTYQAKHAARSSGLGKSLTSFFKHFPGLWPYAGWRRCDNFTFDCKMPRSPESRASSSGLAQSQVKVLTTRFTLSYTVDGFYKEGWRPPYPAQPRRLSTGFQGGNCGCESPQETAAPLAAGVSHSLRAHQGGGAGCKLRAGQSLSPV